MISKSTLTVLAALATLSIASPAFAQTFSKSDGTGNVSPSYYAQGGGFHAGTLAPQGEQFAVRQGSHDQIADRRNGLRAFAMVPSGTGSGSDQDGPAATGGGSAGYNENLRTSY